MDASADTGAGLSPIAPPALPAFECADGWAAVGLGEGAPTVCDPFPAGLAPCADGAMWIPGDSACAPIGEACPADGGFPTDLPPTGIVYVLAGSAGDGWPRRRSGRWRRGSPPPPTERRCSSRRGATRRGPPSTARWWCAGRVWTRSSSGPSTCARTREVAVATSDSTLDLSRFAVDSSSSTAMIAFESSFRLASGRVRGADPASSVEGPGLLALQGSTIETSQVWLSGMRGFGESAGTPGARIIARDVVIADTQPGGGSDDGQGIVVGPGGHAELDRVWIERSRSVALLVSDADADAVVRDLTILDTAAAPDGFLGRGIQVQSGAHLAAERVRIDGSHEASIIAASGDVELSDLRVTRTLRRACTPCEPASASRATSARPFASRASRSLGTSSRPSRSRARAERTSSTGRSSTTRSA